MSASGICVTHSCLSAAEISHGVKLRINKAWNKVTNAALHVGFFCFICCLSLGEKIKDENPFLISISFLSLRGDKESWIKSKYVEKKFIQKLPETGRNPLLRRSSGRRTRATTQDQTAQRPPIKPKPNRATLPRVTGKHGETEIKPVGF